jgi:hypothetical protein
LVAWVIVLEKEGVGDSFTTINAYMINIGIAKAIVLETALT